MIKRLLISIFTCCWCLGIMAGQTVTWNIVQHIDSLHTGVRVIFGNNAKDVAMGVYDYDVAKSNIRCLPALYGERRHTITVDDTCAYTVHQDGKQFYFVGSDGKYLYMYNTNKNLSSSTTLNSQAHWIVDIRDDSIATFKNGYSSSWQIYFNKTATTPLYCTYDVKDFNLADICLYSDNAPAWQEKELHPHVTLTVGADTIDQLLDFGKIIYDDTWGTEADPYSASKTLTIHAYDITQTFSLSLKQGNVFSLISSSIPSTGGSATISFDTKNAGIYSDTLVIQWGDSVRQVALHAQATTQEQVLPAISLSTQAIFLPLNPGNNYDEMAMMTFSVSDLHKNLYIKWEKGTIPSQSDELVEIIAGTENNEIHFGSATNMGTLDRMEEEIYISATARTEGVYTSTLCFYTPNATDKGKNDFEQRVTLTIEVSSTPTDLHAFPSSLEDAYIVLKNGHLRIIRQHQCFTLLGHIIP